MSEVSFTGGSMVGWVNASWPLARLTASPQILKLSTLGKYEFSPQQVVSFEPYGSIPVLARGIRIVHNRPDYPRSIVFWCMASRDKVLKRMDEAGFRPAGEALFPPRPGGLPIRLSVIISFIVLWNALFFLDDPWHRPPTPGPFSMLAIFLAFVFCLGVHRSSSLQAVVLTKGHSVGEIKSLLILIQVVAAFLLVIFSILWLSGVPAG
jgi:hypothetical protein